MKFRYSCVNCPDISELEYILERERDIQHNTFRNHIGRTLYEQLCKDLGYDAINLTLKKDHHVSYHKSSTPRGETVYYLRHSAIEYIYY